MISDTFYEEHEKCLSHIRNGLRERYNSMENTRTIEESNRRWHNALFRLKREAFDIIQSMNKPYIIYRINRYYQI